MVCFTLEQKKLVRSLMKLLSTAWTHHDIYASIYVILTVKSSEIQKNRHGVPSRLQPPIATF